jgi:hypothetical protein
VLTVAAGAEGGRTAGAAISGPLDTVEKAVPLVDDVGFWLAANVLLFLYVGVEQLAHGYGPGSYYSVGAILMGVIYLMLWMWSKMQRRIALQLMMILSGLAVLGDLVVIAGVALGAFSGTSALLDFVGLMLFHSAYRALKGSP